MTCPPHDFRPIDSTGQKACVNCNARKTTPDCPECESEDVQVIDHKEIKDANGLGLKYDNVYKCMACGWSNEETY